MNAKAKGTRNEHRSMALYERRGYTTVRAGASLGTWDWVGWNEREFIFCQVKTSRWPGTAEMETIKEAVVPPNGRKLVHRWMPRQREPDEKEV